MKETLLDLWIGRGEPTNWSTRSSNLTPLDLFCRNMSRIKFTALMRIM